MNENIGEGMKFTDIIKKDKRLRHILVFALVILLTIVARITYAFFGNNPIIDKESETTTQHSLESTIVDKFLLEVDDAISLVASPNTLKYGQSDIIKTVTAKATIRKALARETYTKDYYLYLSLTNNTFIYSEPGTPEIVLSITKNDVEYTETINGLAYNNAISGYDITTVNGLLPIAVPNSITSTDSLTDVVDTWKITVKFRNLDVDQTINADHALNTSVIMLKNPISFEQQIRHINYITDGSNNIYYHDYTGSYTNSNLELNDHSYRYVGANPKNYVCFGAEVDGTGACPTDNLYRIIGIFNKNEEISGALADYHIKLIKNTAFENAAWQGSTGPSTNNTWSLSGYNVEILNGTYLNSFKNAENNDKWYEMIDDYKWAEGGNSWANLAYANAKNSYNYEMVSMESDPRGNKYLDNVKIGFLYVTDYMYAATPAYWSYPGYDRDRNDYRLAQNNNWLYSGNEYWTITRDTSGSVSAFYINSTGEVNSKAVNTTADVRPVFYLKSNVLLVSGNGTITTPYVISL